MANKTSTLVYKLLTHNLKPNGLTKNEIFRRILDEREITTEIQYFRQQIALALKHGIDYGVLKRSNNRFRPNLEASASKVTKRGKVEKKKVTKTSNSNKNKNNNNISSSRKRRGSQRAKNKNSNNVPRPKVLPPPSWAPKRRNLIEEPLTKIVKRKK